MVRAGGRQWLAAEVAGRCSRCDQSVHKHGQLPLLGLQGHGLPAAGQTGPGLEGHAGGSCDLSDLLLA